ncbi:MAG TPA: OsmC family protein, partial [Cytophagaceae bacterium]
MAQFENKYLGDLRTEAIHLKSGNKIITDAPTDNNGKGEAFSPTDLICAALSACMMTIMGIKANSEKIDIAGMTSEIAKSMIANPRKISEINISFIHPNPSMLNETQREILKKAAHTCP